MGYRLAIDLIDDDGSIDEWTLLPLTDEEAQIVKESAITRKATATLWRKQIDRVREKSGEKSEGGGD